jgi:hypothetical protein
MPTCRIWGSHRDDYKEFLVEELKQPSIACYLLHACFFPSTLKMEAVCSSEKSVDIQWITRRYIPEERIVHSLLTFVKHIISLTNYIYAISFDSLAVCSFIGLCVYLSLLRYYELEFQPYSYLEYIVKWCDFRLVPQPFGRGISVPKGLYARQHNTDKLSVPHLRPTFFFLYMLLKDAVRIETIYFSVR